MRVLVLVLVLVLRETKRRRRACDGKLCCGWGPVNNGVAACEAESRWRALARECSHRRSSRPPDMALGPPLLQPECGVCDSLHRPPPVVPVAQRLFLLTWWPVDMDSRRLAGWQQLFATPTRKPQLIRRHFQRHAVLLRSRPNRLRMAPLAARRL